MFILNIHCFFLLFQTCLAKSCNPNGLRTSKSPLPKSSTPKKILQPGPNICGYSWTMPRWKTCVFCCSQPLSQAETIITRASALINSWAICKKLLISTYNYSDLALANLAFKNRSFTNCSGFGYSWQFIDYFVSSTQRLTNWVPESWKKHEFFILVERNSAVFREPLLPRVLYRLRCFYWSWDQFAPKRHSG